MTESRSVAACVWGAGGYAALTGHGNKGTFLRGMINNANMLQNTSGPLVEQAEWFLLIRARTKIAQGTASAGSQMNNMSCGPSVFQQPGQRIAAQFSY